MPIPVPNNIVELIMWSVFTTVYKSMIAYNQKNSLYRQGWFITEENQRALTPSISLI